jgi:uncharacterized protein YecE (DUF72 family)
VIRCGVAGWDYVSWKGRVYPQRPPTRFDPLRYVAAYFRVLEINRTYYRPASVKDAHGWLARIRDRPNLVLSAKLPEQFVAPGRSWSGADVVEARAGLDRLHSHGRLAAAVLQFAYSFKRTRKDGTVELESAQWLRRAIEAFPGLPVFVEFRHDSWNVPEILDELRARGVGFVNVDQPLLFEHALPPTTHATTTTGYLRMHGRNYKTWGRGLGRKKKSAQNVEERREHASTGQRAAQEASKDDRFDYLYSPDELRELANTAGQIAATPGVRDVLAVYNNHANGKGAVNALMLDAILRRERVPSPPDLFREFGDVLHDYAYPAPPTPEQEELGLFDAP